MTKPITLRSIIVSLLSLCFLSVSAQTTDDTGVLYSYYPYSNYEDLSNFDFWGTSKAETYDVAAHIQSPFLIGTTIESIRVFIPTTTDLSNFKVWLSKELTIANKQNVPDVCEQAATLHFGWNTVTLPEPYTLTSDGVYMGYTLTVDQASDTEQKHPVAITHDGYAQSLFVHSSRTYLKWRDLSATVGSSNMQAVIKGLPRNAAVVDAFSPFTVMKGEESKARIDIANIGSAGVKSVDIEAVVDGQTLTHHFDLGAQSLGNVFGESGTLFFPLPAYAETGHKVISLAITKVNGEPNGATENGTEGSFDIVAFKPKHRVVMEEYTGTWCNNCPRGLVGIEVMKRLYPDTFIPISYHAGSGGSYEPMQVMQGGDFPSKVSSFPSSYLDRSIAADPYFGTAFRSLGIASDFETRQAVEAPAEVEVTASTNDEGTAIEAEAVLTFPAVAEGSRYKVEFVLTADSLHGTSSEWAQENALVGADVSLFAEPEFKPFIEGKSSMTGLNYCDVIVSSSRLKGTDAVLSDAVEALVPQKVSHSFNLAEAVDLKGNSLLASASQLRATALLIDTTDGTIANAGTAVVRLNFASGISAIRTNAATQVEAVYDLGGRRLPHLSKGVNLLQMSDGTVRKVLR